MDLRNSIDKIMMSDKFNCTIYFKGSTKPFRLSDSSGKVEILLDWFIRPCDNGMTKEDHSLAYIKGSEDTQIIELKDVA